jgi:hypothetical protein
MVNNHAEEWTVDRQKKRAEWRLQSFNYAALDAETRIVVQQRTSEIKTLMRRTAQDIIEIGLKLAEVKARLGHGHFLGWLKAEFEWSERTAQNYMRVGETFKSATVADFIPARALYQLASPSTPEAAREEVLKTAAADGRMSTSHALEIIEKHKKAASKLPEIIQPVVALAAEALAETLQQPLTDGLIERVGENFELAIRTGTVAVDGENLPLTAALAREQDEAIQRRNQHMRENSKRKPAVFNSEDVDAAIAFLMKHAGKPLRIVIYEVTE